MDWKLAVELARGKLRLALLTKPAGGCRLCTDF